MTVRLIDLCGFEHLCRLLCGFTTNNRDDYYLLFTDGAPDVNGKEQVYVFYYDTSEGKMVPIEPRGRKLRWQINATLRAIHKLEKKQELSQMACELTTMMLDLQNVEDDIL